MRTKGNVLFAKSDLGTVLRSVLQTRVAPAVDGIPKGQFLSTPTDDVIEHLHATLSVDPIQVYEDQMQTTDQETQVDVSGDQDRYFRGQIGPCLVPGQKIVIEIPYTGDNELWYLKPDSYQSVFPHGDVSPPAGDQPGTLRLTFSTPVDNLDIDRLKNEIDHELKTVRFFVESSTRQIAGFNDQLRTSIEQCIAARNNRISKTDGLVTKLGLPLKRNPDAPPIEPITITRKLVRPLPAPPKSGFEPEPGIDDNVFEHILKVIRHEIATFEATPATYKKLAEEELRDILLAHLNGHYEGGATGETFRYKGKTDIRIEAENRAAFVAECKIWSGKTAMLSALDQLLGYLTWRDSKAALVFFNKNVAGFTQILEKAFTAFEEHSKFKREHREFRRQNERRYTFQSPEDELREITVHVFIANLFV